MSDDRASLEDTICRFEKRLAREKAARKQAEDLLEHKSRELYLMNKNLHQHMKLMEAAIVNARDAVIITKANIHEGGPEIVYVNDAFTRISGYEPHEVIGKTPKVLQGPATSQKVLSELKDCLLKGKPFKGELQNYTKDGILYWIDISITPVKNEAGEITHFTAIERDITSRKAFEKELQIHREAAEVANRVKGDFLANMSHELRTPMNGIIGLSELLMEMELGEEPRELAEAVNSSSRNLLILLNDILDLSKIEAGELTLEHIPFNLRRIVHQTEDLLRPLAEKKGIAFQVVTCEKVVERIMSDPARLQQIINNLLSNAIKFTDVGFVKAELSMGEDMVGDPLLLLKVKDSGIGIPEDKQEAVFKKFTQADVSTARKYGGTGLGLAITKELVERMGGGIRLESQVGRGTTFFVEIPVEIPKAQQPEHHPCPQQRLSSIDITGRLLVVDDHPVNLLFMRKVLQKIGFSWVDQASSGFEALALAQKTRYDLVFMDCQMPEMDGFEAAEKIRLLEGTDIGTIPIIAVTADAMKGARERCLDSGMNDYISKPVDVEKLRDILRKWMPSKFSAMSEEESPQGPSSDTIAASPAESLIIDWNRIEMFTDGDAKERQELISIFIAHADDTLEQLRVAKLQSDYGAWKKAAHKLKGSAANLGAQELSKICLFAETAPEDLCHKDDGLFLEITQAYSRLCQNLSA